MNNNNNNHNSTKHKLHKYTNTDQPVKVCGEGADLKVEAEHEGKRAEAAPRAHLLGVHPLVRVHPSDLLHLLQLEQTTATQLYS